MINNYNIALQITKYVHVYNLALYMWVEFICFFSSAMCAYFKHCFFTLLPFYG